MLLGTTSTSTRQQQQPQAVTGPFGLQPPPWAALKDDKHAHVAARAASSSSSTNVRSTVSRLSFIGAAKEKGSVGGRAELLQGLWLAYGREGAGGRTQGAFHGSSTAASSLTHEDLDPQELVTGVTAYLWRDSGELLGLGFTISNSSSSVSASWSSSSSSSPPSRGSMRQRRRWTFDQDVLATDAGIVIQEATPCPAGNATWYLQYVRGSADGSRLYGVTFVWGAG